MMNSVDKIDVHIVNAFVDNGQGGNAAGVVIDADHLSNANKLEIASKVGLSETAFVSKSNSADFKLDFFTPTKQIAHCGHATIATFSYLKQLGIITDASSSKETIDGTRKIKFVGDSAYMEQSAPKFTDVKVEEQEQIMQSLGLSNSHLINGLRPMIVNTGNSFMIIPLNEENALQSLDPDFNTITEISERHDLIGYYVFIQSFEDEIVDVQTRMFAPFYGIEEEAATGMAAGPLASFLYTKMRIHKSSFTIGQGKYMKKPSPSLIHVNLDIENDKITALMAGGKGLLMNTKEINL